MKKIHVCLTLLTCAVVAAYLLTLRWLFASTSPQWFNWSRDYMTSSAPADLLILAHGRSGSSFLGQAFNAHHDVFYMYEPLAVLQATSLRHSPLYEQSAKQLLEDIFKCNFGERTAEFLSFLSSMPLNRFSSRALTVPFCRNATHPRRNRTFFYCDDLTHKKTTAQCAAHKHKVVKILTHRMPNGTLKTLKDILGSGKTLRVLHLVRDPRAIAASMNRVGWMSEYMGASKVSPSSPLEPYGDGMDRRFDPLHRKTRRFCSSLVKTTAFALDAERELGSDRYKLVRYEDLVGSVGQVTKELFDFAGIAFVERVNDAIYRNTHSQSARSEYSTLRSDISSRVDSWRRELDERSIRMVEKYCSPVLKLLHYIPVYRL